MKLDLKDPPRVFAVGDGGAIKISDCGNVALAPDEQVTFVTESGAQYDVARKSWGFYATPSTNGRLKSFGLRAALVKNAFSKYYIMLVEAGKENDFIEYLRVEKNHVVAWLDDDLSLARLADALSTNQP